MAAGQCPGQDRRFWKPEDIFEAACPGCGAAVEFWKDDPARPCPACGRQVTNPRLDHGCAAWCAKAEECLAAGDPTAAVRDAFIREMRAVFGDDRRRIDHALEVLAHAETIREAEGGDPLVVQAAAILHDIGIAAAESRHGSAAPRWQELEGPPVARPILERCGVPEEARGHVLDIIASHHSAGRIDTVEFRVLWDADRLANWADEVAGKPPEAVRRFIDRAYRTGAGRRLAHERLEAAEKGS